MNRLYMDKLKRIYNKMAEPIVSFLFIALVFYLLYIALWTFCPCP